MDHVRLETMLSGRRHVNRNVITVHMNHSFYQQILSGEPSHIFDDLDNVIWIDWGDEEDAIVDAIRAHINLDNFSSNTVDADNDQGYVVIVSFGDRSLTIDPTSDFDSRHATLNTVDELLSDHQIRFATPTNGSDTIAVAIERESDWQSLYNEFGQTLNQLFCPIRELPDLMNTPGNEIDEACENYANRIG